MFRHLYSEKEYVTNNYQKKYNPNSAACVGELTISVFRSLETMKHIDNMILVMCFCENKQTSVRFRTAGLQVLTIYETLFILLHNNSDIIVKIYLV